MEHVTDDCQCTGKWCSKCEQSLCVGKFGKNRSTKDRLAHYCLKCYGEYRKQYDHDNRAALRGYRQKWLESHPNYMQEWVQSHPEEVKNMRDKWLLNNLEFHSESRRRSAVIRRTRETQSGGLYTLEEWEMLKARYDYRCLRCGKQEPEIKLTVDHVVPVIVGGTSNIDNIQPLCWPCNSWKRARTIDFRPQNT